VATVKAARRVAKKSRTFVAGERDPKKLRHLWTDAIDGALHFVDDVFRDLDFKRTSRVFVNEAEPASMAARIRAQSDARKSSECTKIGEFSGETIWARR
jgi:hypothetical protein